MSENNLYRRADDEIDSKLRLLAELQVYQAELETQNCELREAQQLLEETRDRYANLYDFAPVGYLTLDKTGVVQSINLTGSTMLNKQRAYITGNPFITCLAQSDSQAFFNFLKLTFNASNNTTVDLQISISGKELKYLRLESSAARDADLCRVIMTDITHLQVISSFNKQLLSENRRLLQNIFSLQEQERRSLARELHDELGQWLTAIYAEAEIISQVVKENPVALESSQAIKECTKEMHDVIRGMLHKLRPALLDTLGLTDALFEMKEQWCARHRHIQLELNLTDGLDKFKETTNITVYRIVQEALTNICNHSNASKAQVSLKRVTKHPDGEYLHLHIEDNGKGYETDVKTKGLGMAGMRERAIALGGQLAVCSEPGKGTQIEVKLPINNHLDDRKKTKNNN